MLTQGRVMIGSDGADAQAKPRADGYENTMTSRPSHGKGGRLTGLLNIQVSLIIFRRDVLIKEVWFQSQVKNTVLARLHSNW